MDLAQDNLTPVHQEVLHELDIKQPYTGSLSSRCSFTWTRHPETLHRFSLSKNEVLHELIIKVTLHRCPSFQDAVLHELIIRKPYIGSLFQLTKITVQKFPQESPIQFPQESWNPSPQAVSLSPVDSGSLSSQSTNASPGFIQRVISVTGYNWVILSQKPRKERPRQNIFPTPSKVYQHFQHNKDIPSGSRQFS